MDDTSLTLIEDVGQDVPGSWQRLDRVYRPFLVQWFRSKGVRLPDADDLAQDVLIVLFEEIKLFRHPERLESFRGWLCNVCTNRLLGYLRKQRNRGTAVGGTDSQARLDSLTAENDWCSHFDRQHDQSILGKLFDEVSTEFAPSTMQAFRRLTLDSTPAPEVAAELELTLGAVYIAKSRVLRRLRQLASGFLDDRLLPSIVAR